MPSRVSPGCPRPAVRPRRRWLPAGSGCAARGKASEGLAAEFGFAVYRFRHQPRASSDRNRRDADAGDRQERELIEILDTKTNRKINLKAGTYQIELSEGKDRGWLSTSQFTLERAVGRSSGLAGTGPRTGSPGFRSLGAQIHVPRRA